MSDALKHASVSKIAENSSQVAKVAEWKRAHQELAATHMLREKKLIERKEVPLKNTNLLTLF